jgi:FKBP-type peptidyl-prolyl cis-trans isomerase FklB
MKQIITLFAVVATLFSTQAQTLKTYNDSLNYAIGVATAEDMKARLKNFEGMDKVLINSTFAADLNGETMQMNLESARKFINAWQRTIKLKEIAPHKAANEAFLVENGKKAGVVTLPSGLQYEIMTKGTGAVSPLKTDGVKVHYHGTYIDGKVFDSSVDRGTPADFNLSGVVAGFSEALTMMKTGDKWRVTMPQNLAYGEAGKQPTIKPFTTLVFEMELLEILDASKAPAPRPKPAMPMPQGMPTQPKSKN